MEKKSVHGSSGLRRCGCGSGIDKKRRDISSKNCGVREASGVIGKGVIGGRCVTQKCGARGSGGGAIRHGRGEARNRINNGRHVDVAPQKRDVIGKYYSESGRDNVNQSAEFLSRGICSCREDDSSSSLLGLDMSNESNGERSNRGRIWFQHTPDQRRSTTLGADDAEFRRESTSLPTHPSLRLRRRRQYGDDVPPSSDLSSVPSSESKVETRRRNRKQRGQKTPGERSLECGVGNRYRGVVGVRRGVGSSVGGEGGGGGGGGGGRTSSINDTLDENNENAKETEDRSARTGRAKKSVDAAADDTDEEVKEGEKEGRRRIRDGGERVGPSNGRSGIRCQIDSSSVSPSIGAENRNSKNGLDLNSETSNQKKGCRMDFCRPETCPTPGICCKKKETLRQQKDQNHRHHRRRHREVLPKKTNRWMTRSMMMSKIKSRGQRRSEPSIAIGRMETMNKKKKNEGEEEREEIFGALDEEVREKSEGVQGDEARKEGKLCGDPEDDERRAEEEEFGRGEKTAEEDIGETARKFPAYDDSRGVSSKATEPNVSRRSTEDSNGNFEGSIGGHVTVCIECGGIGMAVDGGGRGKKATGGGGGRSGNGEGGRSINKGGGSKGLGSKGLGSKGGGSKGGERGNGSGKGRRVKDKVCQGCGGSGITIGEKDDERERNQTRRRTDDSNNRRTGGGGVGGDSGGGWRGDSGGGGTGGSGRRRGVGGRGGGGGGPVGGGGVGGGKGGGNRNARGGGAYGGGRYEYAQPRKMSVPSFQKKPMCAFWMGRPSLIWGWAENRREKGSWREWGSNANRNNNHRRDFHRNSCPFTEKSTPFRRKQKNTTILTKPQPYLKKRFPTDDKYTTRRSAQRRWMEIRDSLKESAVHEASERPEGSAQINQNTSNMVWRYIPFVGGVPKALDILYGKGNHQKRINGRFPSLFVRVPVFTGDHQLHSNELHSNELHSNEGPNNEYNDDIDVDINGNTNANRNNDDADGNENDDDGVKNAKKKTCHVVAMASATTSATVVTSVDDTDSRGAAPDSEASVSLVSDSHEPECSTSVSITKATWDESSAEAGLLSASDSKETATAEDEYDRLLSGRTDATKTSNDEAGAGTDEKEESLRTEEPLATRLEGKPPKPLKDFRVWIRYKNRQKYGIDLTKCPWFD